MPYRGKQSDDDDQHGIPKFVRKNVGKAERQQARTDKVNKLRGDKARGGKGKR